MLARTPPDHFNGRRYHAWNDWVRTSGRGRVQKVSLDAGFSCPNRDGTVGHGGCSFCNNRAFTPAYLTGTRNPVHQLTTGIAFLRHRYPASNGYLAYFQAYTNTHGDVDHLRQLYMQALSHPGVKGLAIGTRPDCLPDAVLDLLAELAQRCIVELEIGIESCNDAVLARCGRGHDMATSIDAIRRAASRGLSVTGHLLLGLPGETRSSLLDGARVLGTLPLAALKFHQLQIVRGSALGLLWLRAPGSIPVLGHEEYLDHLVDMLEHLPASLRIQRLASEVPMQYRLSPPWPVRLSDMPALLTARLAARDTWQGRLVEVA